MRASLQTSQKTILYSTAQGRYDSGLLEDMLEPSKIGIVRTYSVQEALDLIVRVKYDAILTDILLPPGTEMLDPQLKELWERLKGETYNYGEVGLHFIRRVRQPPSINRETPIVVGTLVDAVNSVLLPNAKRRALKAGANAYVDIGVKDGGYRVLVDKIVKLTQSR